MARYLNIYLVPKNVKDAMLSLTCYWDCSNEFNVITKELNIPCPEDDSISYKEQYTELYCEDIKRICEKQENKIKDCDKRIKGLHQSLKYIVNKEIAKSILFEIDGLTEDKDKYQSVLTELNHLKWFVECIDNGRLYDYLYFEKVVMNISVN